MKVAVFTKSMKIGTLTYFSEPKVAVLHRKLDGGSACELAQAYAGVAKEALQVAQVNGVIVVGVHLQPIAILVPETSERFGTRFMMSHKMRKG